jgi:hypothetical protein
MLPTLSNQGGWMHGKSFVGIAAAVALSAGAALAQEQTFSVYGFADAAISKVTLEDNHFVYPFASTNLNMGLKHFNLYFDFKPNSNTRALLEMAMSDEHVIGGGLPNRIIVTRITGIDQLPPPAQAALAAAGIRAERKDTVVLGRELARFGKPSIERAYFELLLSPMANLRFGKFITPAGIWNVDHGSPVILTYKQPYQTENFPIFPNQQVGAALFGNGYFGDHDWDYTAYISTGSDPDGNKLKDITYLSGGAHAAVGLDLPVKTKIGVSGYSGLTRKTTIVATAVNTVPITNLLTPTFQPNPAAINALKIPPGDDKLYYSETATAQQRSTAMGVDLRLDFHAAFIQSEYNTRTDANELMGDKESALSGFYTIFGYRQPVRDWLTLTPYLMYEGLWWEDAENIGVTNSFAFMPCEGFDVYLAGLNVGLFGNVYVKLEYSLATMRLLDAPPAIPLAKNNYTIGETIIQQLAGQFAVAF